jgi:O-methyltransferase
MIEPRCVDLFYLTSNRLEFTRETLSALLANTDWEFVREFVVNDNNSIDGTKEWVRQAIKDCPAPVRWIEANYTSPVAAMLNFIRSAHAPILAKVDNDAMMPPGWLRQSLEVMDRHPELQLLGTEAMYAHSDDPQTVRSYTQAEFISGLGLYRRLAFARSQPAVMGKYFGLEEWQMAQPRLVRGWITPALGVFLLDRLPFEPWITYSKNYMARGWQRDSYKYEPASTLWKWHWPGDSTLLQGHENGHCSETPSGDPRFLGVMRIKNESAFIHEVLSRALRLCRHVLVFDDHSTDNTVAICESFGDAVTVIRSPFQGLDEARDKNFILERISSLNPEFVFWIDGDEVLEYDGPEQIRAAVDATPGAAAWYLRIVYLWDHREQVRVDGLFGNFRRLSLFRFRGQPVAHLKFRVTGFGGNFHCGNVPAGLRGEHRDLTVRLKHYGCMTQEQRLAKHAFYTSKDPGNQLEDNYRHLLGIPGARHAPGPVKLMPWVESMPTKKTAVTSRKAAAASPAMGVKALSEPVASAWLQLLKKTLVRYPLDAAELDSGSKLTEVEPALRSEIERWIDLNHRRQLHEAGPDPAVRLAGKDWPATAESMMGVVRMDHLLKCAIDVLQQKVPGDLAEIGVWRGGVGIMMLAALRAMGDTRRKVWLADSFRGYPHPDPARYPADNADPHHTFRDLVVSLDTVQQNVARYGFGDSQISYLTGWYRDTLPSAPMERIALLHLDCDMYESNMVALRSLYSRISPGGYIIVDDYGAVAGCRRAVDDFRREQGIDIELQRVDWTAVSWQVSQSKS